MAKQAADEAAFSVVGIDVGFRASGWVRLNPDGRLEFGTITTPAPPSKRVRVAGELALCDDDAIRAIFDRVRDLLEARPTTLLVYEVPGKGQGARAVETMAFARSAIVSAGAAAHVVAAQVTPADVDRAVNPPPPPRLPPLRKPKKGAPPEVVAAFVAQQKAQKKEKERRRAERKASTAAAIGDGFPELKGLAERTSDWSHVCDAAAVLVAEASFGSSIAKFLPRPLVDRLVAIGKKGRARA